jgi:uncharacterized OB-fold protein
MTQVSINDSILDISGDVPRLKGMRCKTCDNHVFPFQKGCPRCAGTDVEPVDLGTRGTLWAWTIQGFPPKAPPYLGETDPEKFKPFGVGYVELPGQTKVETRLTESDPTKLAEGMEMELTLEPISKDEDGNDIVTYAFKPV